MTLPRFPARFEQVEELSSTPLERTFRAVDTLLQREVLLRLPPVEAWSGWSADVRLRLLREAQALAKIQHDGVASVLWVEEIEDGLLVVQNPPAGERLGEALKHGAMTVDAVVDLGIELGRALAAVHFANVVHRGVGVDAVWILPNGRARLGAFHFAKALDARLGGSSLNHGLRKKSGADEEAAWLPPYSAPEQLAGKSADARADVFALGCLLFRCLTGHDPLLAVEGGQMPDVRSARKDVPKAVADVVRRCMLVEKTARFPTAQAVAEALEAGKVSGGGGRRGGTSRRAVLGVAGLAVAGVLGVVLWPGSGIDKPLPDDPNPRPSDATSNLKDSYTKGHALLIGVSQAYDARYYPKLKGPVSEIEAVKDRLMQTNGALWNESSIQVLREEHATQKAVEDAIARIKREAGPDDAVLIYFAGHGTPKAGTNRYFLVCSDANSKDPGVAGSNGFLDKQELDFTGDGAMPAKHVLVVADCCYSGRLFTVTDTNRGRPTPDPARDVTKVHPHLRRRVVEFLGSSSDEPAKDAKSGELSKFCQAFLDELTPKGDGRCYVTVRQMAANIESKLVVPDATVEQFPSYEKIAGSGQFVFFLPGK